MEQQTIVTLRALLAETARSHHHFELNELGGNPDEDWPTWYASYLLSHGLGDLIDRRFDVDELSRLLRTCDVEYQRDRPGVEWPDYYARRIAIG